jgi:hypothetical protein
MLFKSVGYALKAEKILKAAEILHKLIPVPKQISSDCGICLRFEPSLQTAIQTALADKVEFEEICPLTH